jgi:hypothetical protein
MLLTIRLGFLTPFKAPREWRFLAAGHVFEGDHTTGKRPQILDWHEQGLFSNEPRALPEALTCACFLGRTRAAEYLLRQSVAPSGGANTGLNAFHWAANRGQLEAVRLLIQWNTSLQARSKKYVRWERPRYGSLAAIHEPRPDHVEIIEELLKAGARLESEAYPTGYEHGDAILWRFHTA